MFYYKIIKDGIVIDVNNTFYRYLTKHRNIVKCDSKYAQLIKTSDGKNFYTAEWLMPLPEGVKHEIVEAKIISKEEYEELKSKLSSDLTIREDSSMSSAAADEEPVIEPEKAQEEVMSVTEMRQHILKLEALVKELLNK